MEDIEFLLEALELKDEERAWIDLFNINNSESVADHSWSAAFLTLSFGREKDIELERALKMAIVHDLGEARIGDIANRKKDQDREVSKKEKQRREKEAWKEWMEDLGENELMELWEEFEAQNTREAKFVKDIDLIELCLQALKYEKNGDYPGDSETDVEDMEEVFENSRERSRTEFGEKKISELRKRYEKAG